MLELPPAEDAAIAPEDIPLNIVLRGRRAHRHRQAGRARRASRRRQLDRHAGQRARSPIAAHSLSGIGGDQAPRHRASARQGHQRAHGGGQDRSRPPRAQPRSSPTTAAARPLRRGYLAFVWGAPERPRGTIDKPIGRHPHARDKMAVRAGGRAAVTHWEVLERYPRQRRNAGREPARLPAGDRTHPPDPRPPRLDRPPAPRRRRLWRRLQDQGESALAAGARSRAGSPWQTGPACLFVGYRTSPRAATFWSSDRNCRAIFLRLHHSLGAQGAMT